MISHSFIIILFFLMIICSLPIVSSLDILQKVMAQTTANNTNSFSSSEGAKVQVLIDDTIQALKSRDTKGALVHLNILSQQLTALGNSSFAKVLIDDANRALKNGDTNTTLVHLNLAKQQLAPNGSNIVTTATTTPSSPARSQINKVQSNHPPIAYDDKITIANDASIITTLKGSDPDSDPITFSIISEPSNGQLQYFNPTTDGLTYNPHTGYTGTDSFSFL
jgi:hypothetical protein